jgi:hypothetical protein
MDGLIEGRIVHHCSQLEGQVGTAEYAAIISRVHAEHHPEAFIVGSIEASADNHNDGDVDLFAFMENTPIEMRNVPYSAEKLPNSWHCIERA